MQSKKLIFNNIFYLFYIQFSYDNDYLAARCLGSRCDQNNRRFNKKINSINYNRL